MVRRCGWGCKRQDASSRTATQQLHILAYASYLLTATSLTPGGSSTVLIYTQSLHRTTQLTTLVGRFSGII
jgi:uncharacterized integral membrane protein